MLGVSLVFVGITLVLNGLIGLNNWNKKDLVLINFLTGGIILLFNLYSLITSQVPSNDIHYLGGLLFGFTNIFIAIFAKNNESEKFFGYYCLLSTISALILGIYLLVVGSTLAGIFWLVWMLIWLFGFIGYSLNQKFQVATNLMFIIQGATTTFLFGFLILMNVAKLY